MKTSNVFASFLCGSVALAAPLKQRDMVTMTDVVTETVVVYTTVWDEPAPVAEATATSTQLYEQPSEPATSAAQLTPSSTTLAFAPPTFTPPVESPSSEFTPTPSPMSQPSSDPQAAPESIPAPEPEPESSTPAHTSVPLPTPSPVPQNDDASTSNGDSSSGKTYHSEATVYDATGAPGACGGVIADGDYKVALAKGLWGESTYDVMTGDPTNPWCGQKITVEYNGKTVDATIMDMCPGETCMGTENVDLTRAAWNDLTGGLGGAAGDRVDVKWWKSS